MSAAVDLIDFISNITYNQCAIPVGFRTKMKRKLQDMHTLNSFLTMSKLKKLFPEKFNELLDDTAMIKIKGGGGDPPPWKGKK